MLRYSHRAMLIVHPAIPPGRRPAIPVDAVRSLPANLDEDPTEEVSVYLADLFELGLWYRLAPSTFMGTTLAMADRRGPRPVRSPPHWGRLPFTGRWMRAYHGGMGAARRGAAAARQVEDAAGAGQASR